MSAKVEMTRKSYEKVTLVYATFLLVGILTFASWAVTSIYCSNMFDRDFNDYLHLAQNSGSIERVRIHLLQAISYFEKRELIGGYTDIFYKTPQNDVGIYYVNLVKTYESLSMNPVTMAELERSRVLIKLSCKPKGLYIFPYNRTFLIWGWVGTLLTFFGIIGLLRRSECQEEE